MFGIYKNLSRGGTRLRGNRRIPLNQSILSKLIRLPVLIIARAQLTEGRLGGEIERKDIWKNNGESTLLANRTLVRLGKRGDKKNKKKYLHFIFSS